MLFSLVVLSTLLPIVRSVPSSNPVHLHPLDIEARDQVPFLGNNFISLAFHASIVVDNTLYIDGGEVSWNTNGAFYRAAPTNNTLAIDLTKSWAPSSVDIQAIPKTNGPPSLNYGSLWSAADGKSFYAYGGVPGLSPDPTPPNPPNSFWQFSDGAWSQVSQNGNSFPSLTRPASAFAASGNGVGYILGGTDSIKKYLFAGDEPWVPVPGIVSYNMTSGAWLNSSAQGFTNTGTAFSGGFQFVPNFGSKGLLIAMGGETSAADGWFDVGNGLLSFSNISIYDPMTTTWYWQSAAGYTGPADIPGGSSMFCYAGAQSSGSTYEM